MKDLLRTFVHAMAATYGVTAAILSMALMSFTVGALLAAAGASAASCSRHECPTGWYWKRSGLSGGCVPQ